MKLTKPRFKRVLTALCAALLVSLLLFLPGLPWSSKFRYKLRRAVVKAEMTISRWRGHEPRFISLAGSLDLPGAQVQTLDSRSGWATLTDGEGSFILPDLMWYPGASFDLVVSADGLSGALFEVGGIESYPDSGIFDLGKLDFSRGEQVVLSSLHGLNSLTYEGYDRANADYYRDLYDRLTAGGTTDEEKVGALNSYVATKLNYEETRWDLVSPRRILDTGSQYCGHLSAAMETLLATGGYRTRAVQLMDNSKPPQTHVVVEVFYDGEWRLYDPTFGIKFLNKEGKVASYRQMRLDPSAITEDLFSRYKPGERRRWAASLREIYRSGHHHFYYFSDK